MDTSADGGMAPALQSSNHQTTNLVNQKADKSKVKEVAPLEKVNGDSHDSSMCKDTAIDSESSSSVPRAAGDSESPSKIDSEESKDTKSCILSGLKDALPPVLMPAIHIGQGDSTVAVVGNYNGWGDCKRPHSAGILQESNNISSSPPCKTINKKPITAEKVDGKVSPSTKTENHPNGTMLGLPENDGSSNPKSLSKTDDAGSRAIERNGKNMKISTESNININYPELNFAVINEVDQLQDEVLQKEQGSVSPVLRSPLRRKSECSTSQVVKSPRSPVLELRERSPSPVLETTGHSRSYSPVLGGGEHSNSPSKNSEVPVLETSGHLRATDDSTKHTQVQEIRELSQSPVLTSSESTKYRDSEHKKTCSGLEVGSSSGPSKADEHREQSSALDTEHGAEPPVHDHSTHLTPHEKGEPSISPVTEQKRCSNSLDCKYADDKSTLNYTDLLSRDLSQINMSDKLANTLQELTASLKGSPLPLHMDTSQGEIATVESDDTVNLAALDSVHRSVKSLNFSVNESPANKRTEEVQKERDIRIEAKLKSAVEGAGIIDCRLNLLKKNIDMLRRSTVKLHVKKEIKNVASQAPSLSMIETAWPGRNMPALDSSENTLRSLEFWRRILETSVLSNETSERDTNFRVQNAKDGPKSSDNNRLHQSVTAKQSDERKLSGDFTDMDMLPIVQLTRLDKVRLTPAQYQKILRQARCNNGVLKKELRYVMSRCDPELTDSSSDEEVVEPVPVAKTQRSRSSKSGPKHNVTRFRKSFCKWVAERAEISRRWTWLQSRISSLELTIREQGELYGRLREGKGAVHLDVLNECTKSDTQPTNVQVSSSVERLPDNSTTQAPVSVSPCNVSMLVNNIHHQTSRLFDNLSPISGESPSPNLPPGKASQNKALNTESTVPSADVTTSDSRVEDISDTCARTRQLRLTSFRNRTLVKISPAKLTCSKPMKPAVVPNDSSIMCIERNGRLQSEVEDCTSLILKAALHDHSYHAVISSVKDIPLSISVRAVMKSKRKWCKKSSPHKHEKVPKKKSKKKTKHKTQKKCKRLYSAISSGHLDDGSENKRRKLSNQVSDSGKKRSRGGSFDSDLDSPVVVAGFSSYQPTGNGAATPTSEITGQSQTYWKKKKTAEQAYDINNIVIPHGLNSARIEKLAYKEIQTPSWKISELTPIKEEASLSSDANQDLEVEDTSAQAFQGRHDHYEIIEKRKYLAFMEWSISRKGSRGSRMGNIRGPATPEPVSPSSLSYVPSPVSFTGDPFSSVTTSAPPAVLSPAIATSPTSKPGVTTRRMSFDQNFGRPGTPPLHMLQQNQRNTDTSLSHSYSSPTLASWHEGLGSRRGSNDSAGPVNRTLSDGVNGQRVGQPLRRTWDIRTFPLGEEDLRLLLDVDYAKMKLCTGAATDGPDSLFRQGSNDRLPADYTRTLSYDGVQYLKPGVMKRRRTDSRASSLASHDDAARYSDASSASIPSTQRKRRKTRPDYNRGLQSRKITGKGSHKVHAVRNSKHKYLHVRLSETEDESTSDSADSDSNSSDEETSSSYDDAGHIVDDYADPEWEAPSHRHRDRR